MIDNQKRFVWIDLEMTGLSAQIDAILEIATIITTPDLEIVAKGPCFVINQSNEALHKMSPEVAALHKKSGLTEKVIASSITLDHAYQETLGFIKKHCTQNNAFLAGNSVWMDRTFLLLHMPDIVRFLNYRLIDVSSIKLLINSWYPANPQRLYKKSDNHRALEDIEESIEELRHYKSNFFIPSE
jgi:oligoribonuclease